MGYFKRTDLRVSCVVFATFLVLVATLALTAQFAYAAPPPNTMNFQGRLRDDTGNIMADGQYNMQFRIYTVSSGGTAVWTESRTGANRVQLTNGLFSIQLGEVTPLPASLFDNTNLYFEITMATPATATTSGAPTWESPMTPRNKLATSAYAFNAAMLNGKTDADFAAASGSASYIQNTTDPQVASFNVSGTGRVGTSLTVGSATTGVRLTAGGLAFGDGTGWQFKIGHNTSDPIITLRDNGAISLHRVTSVQGANTGLTVATGETSSGAVITGKNGTGSSGDLLQLQNAAGTNLARVDSAGRQYAGAFHITSRYDGSPNGGIYALNYAGDGYVPLLRYNHNSNTVDLGGSSKLSFSGPSVGLSTSSGDGLTFSTTSGTLAVKGYTSGDPLLSLHAQNHNQLTARIQAATSQVADILHLNNGAGISVVRVGNTGSALFQASTNSPTAFQIQNAGSVALFTADTDNNKVIIGSAVNGIEFSANGIVLSGTARGTDRLTVSAEYPGLTFRGDGSSNIGNLTSDFCSQPLGINATACSTGVATNYYQWTTAETAAQDYDLYFKLRYPDRAGASNAGGVTAFTMDGFVTSTSTDSVSATIFKGATTCGTYNIATTNNTWTTTSMSAAFATCDFTAGEEMIIRIRLTAGENNFARVGDIALTYRTQR